jgi:hypothetical protein
MSFTQRTQRSQSHAAPLDCPVPIFHSSFFIMPFPADEFHAKDAKDAKGCLPAGCPVPIFHSSFFILHSSFFIMPFPDGSIGRYSLILPWRPLRPLREIITFQSTYCKQRGAIVLFEGALGKR